MAVSDVMVDLLSVGGVSYSLMHVVSPSGIAVASVSGKNGAGGGKQGSGGGAFVHR